MWVVLLFLPIFEIGRCPPINEQIIVVLPCGAKLHKEEPEPEPNIAYRSSVTATIKKKEKKSVSIFKMGN